MTCTDLFLTQENAHFAISEALIAAIEHMKWNQVLRPAVPPPGQSGTVSPLEDSEVESDEEIVKLKQKIQVCVCIAAQRILLRVMKSRCYLM